MTAVGSRIEEPALLAPALSRAADMRYSLSPLLTCDSCDQPLWPSGTSAGVRVYLFLCGCRRAAIDAGLVERLVRDRVEAESVVLVGDTAADALGAVFRSLFAEVRIGNNAGELAYVWRV